MFVLPEAAGLIRRLSITTATGSRKLARETTWKDTKLPCNSRKIVGQPVPVFSFKFPRLCLLTTSLGNTTQTKKEVILSQSLAKRFKFYRIQKSVPIEIRNLSKNCIVVLNLLEFARKATDK